VLGRADDHAGVARRRLRLAGQRIGAQADAAVGAVDDQFVPVAGPGVGLYIGARLGPGPRDGIMTGVAKRGHSIRVVRTGIELTALLIGWLLGGSVGIGTVLFAVTIGPNVHFWLDRFDMGEDRSASGDTPSIAVAD